MNFFEGCKISKSKEAVELSVLKTSGKETHTHYAYFATSV